MFHDISHLVKDLHLISFSHDLDATIGRRVALVSIQWFFSAVTQALGFWFSLRTKASIA